MMNLNDSLLYVGVDLHVFFECSALAMLGRCQSSLRTAFRHEKQPSSNNQVQSLSFLGSRNDRDWGRVPTIHCVSTTISHRQVCTLEVVTMTTVANADFAAEASQSWASTLKDLDPPVGNVGNDCFHFYLPSQLSTLSNYLVFSREILV